MPPARIDALYLHPIKSLRPVAVSAAQVTPRGFEHDRRLMLVDEEGVFVSQRTLPKMATIEVSLHADEVWVSHAGTGQVQVALRDEGPTDVQVQIWRNRVPARRVGPVADAFFSEVLGQPLRLVRMPEAVHRPVNPRWVPEGGSVSFADGYPMLVITRAAVERISAACGQPFSAEHFRPNIVIAGPEAHAEDGWSGFSVGGVQFDCVKPCDRCVMITRDPQTGEGGPEPLRTLSTYRKQDGKVLFGYNLMAKGLGQIKVGQEVQVLPRPVGL